MGSSEGLDQIEYSAGSFREKTVRGIGWSLVSQLMVQFLNLVTLVVLAHLLSPRDFGLLAMITVITNFANIFAEMGLSSALIQKQDVQQIHLSSVFWLNSVMGLFLALIFLCCSPHISRFYAEPRLTQLTMLISANFVIGSISIVQRTILVKSLDFRRLTLVDVLGVCAGAGVAILMAVSGAGVWSLAWQSVTASFVSTVILWLLSSWRPCFLFEWSAIRDLLGFGSNLLGTQLLNYWSRNLDYILIGRFIGARPLGVYKNAYQIMLFPLANVSQVIARVMFPALSTIQEDKERVRKIFLKVTRAIALVTFPMMLGLFVTVEPFVVTLFGRNWAGMIPILRIFSLVGMMQSIGTLNGNLYLSQGRADVQFRVSLLVRTIAVLGIVIGLRWGIFGVALGYAIASFINSYPSFSYAGRLVNLTYWQLWRNLSGVLGCSIVMAVCIGAAGAYMPPTWPHWLVLSVQVVFGAVLYAALIHLVRLPAYLEVRGAISEYLRQQRVKHFSNIPEYHSEEQVDVQVAR